MYRSSTSISVFLSLLSLLVVSAAQAEAICGDGILEQADEGCDDQNLISGDGCDVSCAVEAGAFCLCDSPTINLAPEAAIHIGLSNGGDFTDAGDCPDGELAVGLSGRMTETEDNDFLFSLAQLRCVEVNDLGAARYTWGGLGVGAPVGTPNDGPFFNFSLCPEDQFMVGLVARSGGSPQNASSGLSDMELVCAELGFRDGAIKTLGDTRIEVLGTTGQGQSLITKRCADTQAIIGLSAIEDVSNAYFERLTLRCGGTIVDCEGQESICSQQTTCGNGVREVGESCDDGNIDDEDGCNRTCQIEPGARCVGEPSMCDFGVCGDGSSDVTEVCDNGIYNGLSGNQCSPDCLLSDLLASCAEGGDASCSSGLCGSDLGQCVPTDGCGDGELDPGEACDNGYLLNGEDGVCTTTCALENGQACGNSADCASGFCSPDDVNPTCEQDLICGDGVLDAGEICDDGNRIDGDGCESTCLLSIGEACVLDSDCDRGECDENICARVTNAFCGDGEVTSDEGCDLGSLNGIDGSGCNERCQVANSFACGALGVIGQAACASGYCPNQLCEPTPLCGNGTIDEGESCDDSNQLNDDGCAENCLLESNMLCVSDADCDSNLCYFGQCAEKALCGDGLLGYGESCDDGGGNGRDGQCDRFCRRINGQPCSLNIDCESSYCNNSSICAPTPLCGNGRIDEGEICDPAATPLSCSENCELVDGQACTLNSQCANKICETNVCVAPVSCGDGIVNQVTEACDDGNDIDDDGCTSDCRLPIGAACTEYFECETWRCDGTCQPGQCGDGLINQIDELCDTRGESADCNEDCTLSMCGDENLNTTSGETCDDGNADGSDGCSDICEVEAGYTCTTTDRPSVCTLIPVCGNGIVQDGEGCDDSNLAAGDGCDGGCVIEPGWACEGTSPSRCEALPPCGNGLLDNGEECDASADSDGSVPCNEDCTLPVCGNGRLDIGESCDDGNDEDGDGCAANTCTEEEGFGCDRSEPSICSKVPELCGDGNLDDTESCDDGNNTNGDGCSFRCHLEDGEACQGDGDCESGRCNAETGLCESTAVEPTGCGNCQHVDFSTSWLGILLLGLLRRRRR